MEKKRCFVIMPISNQGDYEDGHFTKVYEQIIKPAIKDAGFEPYRVDENRISESIMSKIFDAIQNCEMAICDLSNRNPNVLYELGLRHAYDKPVVLIQDEKTNRIFDISGINTVTYSSTRVYDEVLKARKEITQAIKETERSHNITMAKIMKANKAELPDQVPLDDLLLVKINQILGSINRMEARKNTSVINFYEQLDYDMLYTCAEVATKLAANLIDEKGMDKEEIQTYKGVLKDFIVDLPSLDELYYTKNTQNIINIAIELFDIFKKVSI